MANDPNIVINIKADGRQYRTEMGKAAKDTRQFSKDTEKFASSIRSSVAELNLMSGAAKAAGAVMAGIGVGVIANQWLDAHRNASRYEATLKTVFGSQAEAEEKLEWLRKLPMDLEAAVNGLNKLKVSGLEPSREALISYANTAAALGKPLEQYIEAVADATMEQYERLNEFGIKFKREGDVIEAKFEGVTTTIGNNAQEIEAYLRNIGDVRFADGLANQLDSLDGSFQQLGRSWDNFLEAIGDSDFVKWAVQGASGGLDSWTDALTRDRTNERFHDEMKHLRDRKTAIQDALKIKREGDFTDQILSTNRYAKPAWSEEKLNAALAQVETEIQARVDTFKTRLKENIPTVDVGLKGLDIVGETSMWGKLQESQQQQRLRALEQMEMRHMETHEAMRRRADIFLREQLKGLNAEGDGYAAHYARIMAAHQQMLDAADKAERESVDRRLAESKRWEDGVTRGLRSYAEEAMDAASFAEQAMTRAFGSMEDAMVKATMTGKLSFKDMANSIVEDMVRMQIRQNVTAPLAQAGSSFLSQIGASMFGGGEYIDSWRHHPVAHTGGVIGAEQLASRYVPQTVFEDAPRYHRGGRIGANEVPAILQRGEGVFTQGQMAAMAPVDAIVRALRDGLQSGGNGGEQHFHFHFNGAVDARAVAGLIHQNREQIINVVNAEARKHGRRGAFA